ncbi:glycosyltransferase [Muricauda sp. SCSIO 64092]|uniref:glycosyltransferase n=1 Tax=Allomuricauda sp. SCSIO 64092 TaxID=2908842 RepID=UPI001FF294E5|nr:glycosyltransferase [Muricauda sp. SCSIO 64092]UOY05748.1 glycosyltransferase [Muricauda sp. SCSIO 64092]
MKKKDIVIITDFEEGHVYPLFSIARNLQDVGYSVCFVGIQDTLDVITKNGFECIPIFKDIFPRGYVKRLKDNGVSTDSISCELYMQSIFEELDGFMPIIQPKVVFSSFFFSLEALVIHYKYGVKQITFHTLFPPLSDKSGITLEQRSANYAVQTFMELTGPLPGLFMEFFEKENLIFKSFEEMSAPLKKMPQVMLCPRQLNVNTSLHSEKEVYLGPCINLANNLQNNFLQEVIEKMGHRKIIYVSMGSQTKEYPKKAESLFNTVLEAMKSDYFKDFHLVLSLGSSRENWNLVEPPENTDVYSWVPQLEILQLASVAIIHGGLGSIKECIYFGVPMLIIPMGRDQHDNAKRVEHYKLGYCLNLDQFSDETITKSLNELMQNQEIQSNLLQMQQLFLEIEKQKKEVALVKSLIQHSET